MDSSTETEESFLNFCSEPERFDISGGAATLNFAVNDAGVAPRWPIVHLVILVEKREAVERCRRGIGRSGATSSVHRGRVLLLLLGRRGTGRGVVVAAAVVVVAVVVTVIADVTSTSIVTTPTTTDILTTTSTTDGEFFPPLVVRDSPTAAAAAAAGHCCCGCCSAAIISKIKFPFTSTVGASKVGAAAEGRLRVR